MLLLLCVAEPAPAQDISAADQAAVAEAFKAIDASKPKTARAAIERIDQPLLKKAVTWFMMRDLEAASDTLEISEFLNDNPAWPDRRLLRYRAERAVPDTWTPAAINAWFASSEPISDLGRMRLGGALVALGYPEDGKAMLRDVWINGDFTRADERTFYRRYRRHLEAEDHRARLERLLWDGQFSATQRMFPRVSDDIRKLAEARFLLHHRRGNVDKAIAKVPANLKTHEGLVYERMRWRRLKGRDESARELFADAPSDPVRPDLWAKERIELARRALEDGLITAAYELVRDHPVSEDEAALYAESEWLAGWIALRFLDDPGAAYDHFRALYTSVSYPISRARGAYWSARAAEKLGEKTSTAIWYSVASSYPETYYGQLALSRVSPGGALPFPYEPARDPVAIAELEALEPAQAAALLVDAGARNRIAPLLLGIADRHDEPAWQAVVAIYARSLGRPDLAIKVAKQAARNGQIIPSAAFPTLASLGLPLGSDSRTVEPALAHAIIRQESLFFPEARSHAGARGLMQLMPATARQVARQIGQPYNRKRLSSDPAYNRGLGEAYLGQLLETFEGAYVLAIAAYNAGPSRARQWVRKFGDPRDPDVDAIDWVEMIPFDETRNYVQRVLENVQVYRALIDGEHIPVQLAHDLIR